MILTDHAKIRRSQRGITKGEIAMAKAYGKCYYKQGLKFYVMRKVDMPDTLPAHDIKRLNGVTVVTGHDDVIITVYKNPNAPKCIKRKQKRKSNRRQYHRKSPMVPKEREALRL